MIYPPGHLSYYAALDEVYVNAANRPQYLAEVSGSQWNQRFLAALGAQGLRMVDATSVPPADYPNGPTLAPSPSPVDPDARSAFNWWPENTAIVWMHIGGLPTGVTQHVSD